MSRSFKIKSRKANFFKEKTKKEHSAEEIAKLNLI